MRVFISIVCHGHESLIIQLNCLSVLAQQSNFNVIIKNNRKSPDNSIVEYCNENNIHLLDEGYGLGFGENNNYVFNHAVNNLGLIDNDLFLVLNPDVYISDKAICSTIKTATKLSSELTTVNLFKDERYQEPDFCVRNFPSFIDFVSSYVGLANKTVVDKINMTRPESVDWAAGSFLLFQASLYKKLGGFDPSYFMYCEDIDICFRSKTLFNQKLLFIPSIKAIHHAQHANRKLFSRHFVWHVKSMIRYLTLFYGFRKPYIQK